MKKNVKPKPLIWTCYHEEVWQNHLFYDTSTTEEVYEKLYKRLFKNPPGDAAYWLTKIGWKVKVTQVRYTIHEKRYMS